VTLDELPYRDDVIDILRRELGDNGAPARPTDHQAFMSEAANGFPDRTTANPEMTSDRGLADAITRLQLTAMDPVNDDGIDIVLK
jgi:hypothetical protein